MGSPCSIASSVSRLFVTAAAAATVAAAADLQETLVLIVDLCEIGKDGQDDEVRFLRATNALRHGKEDLAIADLELLRTPDALQRQPSDRAEAIATQLVEAYALLGETAKARSIVDAHPFPQLTAIWPAALDKAQQHVELVQKELKATAPDYQRILDWMQDIFKGPPKIGSQSPEWKEWRAKANLKLGHEQTALLEYQYASAFLYFLLETMHS